MTRVFAWEFDVRGYELDAAREVHTAVLHNYLEETATRASHDAGYPMDWYFSRQRAWVMRRVTARYLAPLSYGDRVLARSWVSDFRRIYSHREYDLRRASDGKPVVRARAKWVYVDLNAMRPARIPAQFEAAFDPSNAADDLDIRLQRPQVSVNGRVFSTERRVHLTELDPAGHVNNAIYVGWFGEAMYDAFESAGWPVSRMAGLGVRPVLVGNEIDYLLPARDGAPLAISSRFAARTDRLGAWEHELKHTESGDVLARNYAVFRFVQLDDNQPCTLPESVIKSLMAG